MKSPRKGKAFWIARDKNAGQETWAHAFKPTVQESGEFMSWGEYWKFEELNINIKPGECIKVRLVEVKK